MAADGLGYSIREFIGDPEPPEDDPGYIASLLKDKGDGGKKPPKPPRPGGGGGDGGRRSAGLEPIQVIDGNIDLTATSGVDALLVSELPVFRRDRDIVEPVSVMVPASNGRMVAATSLAEVSTARLVDLLNQAVGWCKWDNRKKGLRAIDPPRDVAQTIIARGPATKLLPIGGVISTPTLRHDGSVLDAPGYDAQTRLYHFPDPDLRMPAMPETPGRADADDALETLQALLNEFPFEGQIDRAVALSAIITAVVRGMMSAAPLHGFRATAAGSGKSYLADLASVIATGQPCPVMSYAVDDPKETEKRLVGQLLAGYPVVSIDNVNGELGGDLLCQAIERPLVRLRPLGTSDMVQIENRALLLATGNNMRVRGDMTRRSLLCGLDANMERPELRTFEANPVDEVQADRGRFVAACLTIVRAYLLAGRPGDLRPLASFEEWSHSVRGALIWLGCADPADSMESAREDDPDLGDLRDFLLAWREAARTPGASVTLRELDIQSMEADEGANLINKPLRDVLLRLAGDRGAVNTRKLNKWMQDKEGRIADGLRFKRDGKGGGGYQKWKLLKA